MRRRDFMWKSTAALGVAGWATTGPQIVARAENAPSEDDGLIERVKRAMLTMQRASWEQGIAAQAYLELGDHDTVYLLAKEAALRQTPDGRLGVVYTDGGTTDGAMVGEALVAAARRSGDPELQTASERELSYVLDKCRRASDGTLYHRVGAPELWIDSMNTTPPFLVPSASLRKRYSKSADCMVRCGMPRPSYTVTCGMMGVRNSRTPAIGVSAMVGPRQPSPA